MRKGGFSHDVSDLSSKLLASLTKPVYSSVRQVTTDHLIRPLWGLTKASARWPAGSKLLASISHEDDEYYGLFFSEVFLD